MSIKHLKEHKFLIGTVLVLFVFYLWMACQIPYTHDDWDWGLQIGIDHVRTADINNRFSGNLIEIALTRSVIAKDIFMSLVFTLIPLFATLFASRIIEVEKSGNADLIRAGIYGFANLLILFIPVDVWQQTNGWIAGFSNFVVSGLALVIFLYILAKSCAPGGAKKGYIFRAVFYVIFGIVSQLFLENLAVFFFLVAVVFLILHWKKKETRKEIIPLCAGLLIGVAIMFSNNIYSSLLHTGSAIDGVRELTYDKSKPFYVFIADSAKRMFSEFVPQIITHQGVTVGCVSLVMAVVTFKKVKNKLASYCLCLCNITFCLYYIATSLAGIFLGLGMIEDSPLTTSLDCAYIVLIIIETVLVFKKDKKLMRWLLTLFLSPFFMMAPMLLIKEVGPRSYYTTNACLIVFALTVLGYILSRAPEKKTVICIALIAVLVAGSVVRWAAVYKPIGDHMRARKQLIETAVANGDDKIVFPAYPNSEYLWIPDPDGSEPERFDWFKEFYHIPSDVTIEFDSWKEV